MSVEIYGIPNCDTIRKARRWLDAHDIDFRFHDYKKEGASVQQLSEWAHRVGWEKLLNRRGTTWRKLSDAEKSDVTEAQAIALMSAHPSLIKRPVLVSHDQIEVGFSEQRYESLFA